MIIKQNIQMQQMVDDNNVTQLFPYTKSNCVIVQDNEDDTNITLDMALDSIEAKINLLEEGLKEVINE